MATRAAAAVLLLCHRGRLADAKQHPLVEYALNAGGPAFTDDALGITYEADIDSVTTATPKGISAFVRMDVARASPEYQSLFQSERYALETFTYSVPTPKDGKYTFVFRFAEAYWTHPQGKIFDVSVAGATVVKGLDIFDKVGKAVAHDEFVEFEIKGNTATFADGATAPVGDQMDVSFVKGSHDNPKVCAILLVQAPRASAKELAPLAPPPKASQKHREPEPYEEDDEDDEDDDEYIDDVDDDDTYNEDVVGETSPIEDESPYSYPVLPVLFAVAAVIGIQQIREML